jgi:hypothetical protein
MNFKNWMENNIKQGEWISFVGTGYTVDLTQYSNKGPMFVVKDHQGKEVGRTHFDMFSNKWKPSIV